ncbi:hypothetical protein [Ornithinicoccus hortensis]|uniref:Capsular polysaccharide biosynthesis protein n=1 Tax=Ornithinicoccus hortensis TaxID=82346 RepID=A0A542YMU8_9MICO|nr:hypothetical protein [Ornithinicoccus hortensis]TQL49422.1 hypothetical protein FB467_0492 [Ornithinicoccus hortensis]
MPTRRWPWFTPFLVLLVVVGAALVLRTVTYQASATLEVAEGTPATHVVDRVEDPALVEGVLAGMRADAPLTDQVAVEAAVLSGPEDGAGDSRVLVEASHPDPRFASAVADGTAATVAEDGGGVSVAGFSEVPTVPDGPRPALLLLGGAIAAWVVAFLGTTLLGAARQRRVVRR